MVRSTAGCGRGEALTDGPSRGRTPIRQPPILRGFGAPSARLRDVRGGGPEDRPGSGVAGQAHPGRFLGGRRRVGRAGKHALAGRARGRAVCRAAPRRAGEARPPRRGGSAHAAPERLHLGGARARSRFLPRTAPGRGREGDARSDPHEGDRGRVAEARPRLPRRPRAEPRGAHPGAGAGARARDAREDEGARARSSARSRSRDRLLMEIALLSDRLDCTEECVRLEAHCDHFLKFLDEERPRGGSSTSCSRR